MFDRFTAMFGTVKRENDEDDESAFEHEDSQKEKDYKEKEEKENEKPKVKKPRTMQMHRYPTRPPFFLLSSLFQLIFLSCVRPSNKKGGAAIMAI